jgi:hypothetical protein
MAMTGLAAVATFGLRTLDLRPGYAYPIGAPSSVHAPSKEGFLGKNLPGCQLAVLSFGLGADLYMCPRDRNFVGGLVLIRRR